MDAQLEYTVPGMPLQNGKVKQKFSMLYMRAQAMLNGTKFYCLLRSHSCVEAANIVMLLEIIQVQEMIL